MTSQRYAATHLRSIEQPEQFWAEEAQRITWHQPFSKVLDFSQPPFARWFVDGTTNLCYNAVDRHLADRADQPALVYISTETGQESVYSYQQLHDEVNRCDAPVGVERFYVSRAAGQNGIAAEAADLPN